MVVHCRSLRCWICFVVAFSVVIVGSIHPVLVVPNIIATTIATSERSEVLKKAVLDFPSVIDGIREPWIQCSCNSTLLNSTSSTVVNKSETESEVAYSSDVDSSQEVLRQFSLTTRFLCCLSMISGFGDVCSMKSYGCFINMVTGSTVRIMMAFLEGRFDSVRVQCCAVSGYIVGICLSQIIHQKHGNCTKTDRSESVLVSLRSVTGLVLSFFSVPEIFILCNRIYGNRLQTILTSFSAMSQAVGYGLMAQTLSDSLSISVNVYVITGQYVAIAKSVIDNFLLKRTKSSWAFLINLRQERAVQVLFSFLFGVLVAAGMYQFCAFLLPFQHSLTGLSYAAAFVWFAHSSLESVRDRPSMTSLSG
jgi:uncharacterized membrane protein YoaK (UPF0700 family)